MTKKPYPSDLQDRFVLRLPDGMRERIAASAKESGRSMNAEIVARLTASYEEAQRPSEEFISKALLTALERMEDLEKTLRKTIERGDGARVRKVLYREHKKD